MGRGLWRGLFVLVVRSGKGGSREVFIEEKAVVGEGQSEGGGKGFGMPMEGRSWCLEEII